MRSRKERARTRKGERQTRAPKGDTGALLASGLEHHLAGRLAEAEHDYRTACRSTPGSADALYLLGRVLCDQGMLEQALPCLEDAVAAAHVAPTATRALADLGHLLDLLGQHERAEAAYRRVIRLDPHSAEAHSNLGIARKHQGRIAAAIEALREAVRMAPDSVSALTNLGNTLADQGQFGEAITLVRRALIVTPQDTDIHRRLCALLARQGDYEAAAVACREWLAAAPDDPVATHMLAAYSGSAVPARASEAYITAVFDEFAATFDQELESLHYQAPEVLGQMLVAEGVAATGDLRVLDAGCGTGLCGVILRPYASWLGGVDLSAKMVRKSADTGLYDELVVGELTVFLGAHQGEYDLITAADTLNYFGDLSPVLQAARAALREGGRLCFSLERHTPSANPEGKDVGYCLQRHGRYAHSPDYVTQCVAGAGLKLCRIAPCDLRQQAGIPVSGLLVMAALPECVGRVLPCE